MADLDSWFVVDGRGEGRRASLDSDSRAVRAELAGSDVLEDTGDACEPSDDAVTALTNVDPEDATPRDASEGAAFCICFWSFGFEDVILVAMVAGMEFAGNVDTFEGMEVVDTRAPVVDSCDCSVEDINDSEELDVKEVEEVSVFDGSTGSRPVILRKRGTFLYLQKC